MKRRVCDIRHARFLALALAVGGPAAAAATPFGSGCLDYTALPHWVGEVRTPYAFAIASDGNTVYLGLDGGILIFDASDPVHLRQVGAFEMGTSVRGLAALGPILYVATNRLLILDARQPASVAVLGSLDLPSPACGVTLAGTRAYVACSDQGVVVAEVSNPAHPVILSQVDTPGRALHVEVAGNVAFVSDYDRGLSIVDFSNLAVPSYLAFVPIEGRRTQTCALHWNQLLVGEAGRIEIYNVRDPAVPRLEASIPTPGEVLAIRVQLGLASIADGWTVSIMELEDGPAHVVFRVGVPPVARDLTLQNDFLLVAGQSGLSVVQAREGGLAAPLARIAGDGDGVVARGSRAYLSTAGNLEIYDLTEPAAPVRLGTVPAAGVITAVSDSTAFLRYLHYTFPNLENGIELVDIRDPAAPRLLSTWIAPDEIGDASVDEHLLYVTIRASDAFGPRVRLVVLDVADPVHPREIVRLRTMRTVEAVAVQGGLACLVAGDSLQTLDVSDPSQPRFLGRVSLADPVDIAVEGSHAYVALQSDALAIVDVSSPAQPVRLASVRLLASARQVAVRDGIAYVTESSLQVDLIDVVDPSHPVRMGLAPVAAAWPAVQTGVATVGGALLVAMQETGDAMLIFPAGCPRTTPVAFADVEAARSPSGVLVRMRLLQDADAIDVLRSEGEALDASAPIRTDVHVAAGPWEYLDRTALDGVAYTYALEIVTGGVRQRTIALRLPATGAGKFSLALASGNPTRGPVRLSFTVAQPAVARLDVYDVAGRLVRRLHAGPAAGGHLVVWDGRDERGREAAAGTYFARLESAGNSASTRIVRIR